MNIHLRKCERCGKSYDMGEKCPYCFRERIKKIEDGEDG